MSGGDHPEAAAEHGTDAANLLEAVATALVSEHGDEGHHDNSFYAILFLFMSLLVGAVSRHLLAKLPIPYTVFLLVSASIRHQTTLVVVAQKRCRNVVGFPADNSS